MKKIPTMVTVTAIAISALGGTAVAVADNQTSIDSVNRYEARGTSSGKRGFSSAFAKYPGTPRKGFSRG